MTFPTYNDPKPEKTDEYEDDAVVWSIDGETFEDDSELVYADED